MADFFQIIRWGHIAAGTIALIVFWIPAFAKKGGKLHIRAGWVYVVCMSVVVVTAFTMSGLAFTIPLTIRRITQPLVGDALQQFLLRQRLLASFLGYLGLATFAAGWQGIAAIRTRRNPEAMRTTFALLINAGSVLASLTILMVGIRYRSGPLMGMSPVGLLVGLPNLRYLLRGPATRMDWWYQHMVAMIVTGIAGYTAFLVFGADRTIRSLQYMGPLITLFWVLPGIIGTLAIILWVGYYRRKFKATGVSNPSSQPATIHA